MHAYVKNQSISELIIQNIMYNAAWHKCTFQCCTFKMYNKEFYNHCR
jgi:hypothetical protein